MEKIFFCDPAMEKNIIYIQGAKIFFQSISGPLHIHGRVIRFCLNLNAAVWNIVWNDEYFTQMPLLISSTWTQSYRCANRETQKFCHLQQQQFPIADNWLPKCFDLISFHQFSTSVHRLIQRFSRNWSLVEKNLAVNIKSFVLFFRNLVVHLSPEAIYEWKL